MAKMRAMVVRERGGPLAAEERDMPVPGPEEMRIRVQACGVCHSDVVTAQGLFPIVHYPRIPGHEVIGSSTPSARASMAGASARGRASAGSAVRAAIAADAGATMRLPARMCTKSAA
jgi:alcohol dehydrogenase